MLLGSPLDVPLPLFFPSLLSDYGVPTDKTPRQLAQGIRKNTENVADIIDSRIDQAAHFVRETLSSSPWIPSVIKPPPPPKPMVAVVTASRLEQVQGWVSRHKILTGVIVLVCGTVIFKGYQTHRSARKLRRAKRARNGGRTEVVVIAGSPTLPLTKSLALDMERRGFIVFVVCNAAEDESLVSALSRPDIRPLSIDTTDVCLPPLKYPVVVTYMSRTMMLTFDI